MSELFRARAGVVHSLMNVLNKQPTEKTQQLLTKLRGGPVDKIVRLPGIGWVDEADFMGVIDVCHRELGDIEYPRVIHAASMVMLKTGIVRAARAASDVFVKASVGGYARWTPRIWNLCFQGLQLEYVDRTDDTIRMYLKQPPAGKFTRSIVLGAAGIVQSVFTLAKKAGTVTPAPFRERDERVVLLLQKESIARSA